MQYKKLGEICAKKSSNIAQKDILDRNGEYPIYGASGFIKNVDFYKREEEYIAIVKDGAGVGRVFCLPAKSSVIGTMQYILPNKSVDIRYLYYVLQKLDLARYNLGAAIPHIYFKDYQNETVALPSIREQRDIVNKLDKLEELISAANLQLAKLDELVKAKFVEMFGDVNINNKKWRVSKYGVEFQITSGGTPSTVVEDYWKNGEISWIGSNMCKDLILRENDGKYITELGLQNSSAKIFEEGTVLVALVGATIGRTALLKFATATNQNIAAIIVKGNDLFLPEFVYFDLQEHYGKFQDVGKGKFKMANQAFVRDLPIICPPRELQNQFADYVCKVDGIKDNVRKKLDNLETLKKSLMQEYFG